jgi:hypothetical protein
MKQLFVWIFILVVFASAGTLTRSEAYQKITDNLLAGDLDGRSILAMNRLVPGSDVVSDMHGQTFRAPSTSYFFLVDDHFTANWDHPCRYVFVDANTGDMTVYPGDAPVRNGQAMDKLFTSTVSDGMTRYNEYNLPVLQTKAMVDAGKRLRLNNPTGENYAILFSGGYDMYNNHSRYYGDIYWILTCLKNDYGYTNDHIFVAMSDGTNPAIDQDSASGYINSNPDIDGDGQQETNYAASNADFTSLVNTLAGIMTSNDNLFLFVTDHGGGSGSSSYINGWAGWTLPYQTLKSQLDSIPHANLSACNEVCYSGGLILAYTGAENVALATACTAYQNSWARSAYLYDEFTFWWTGAMHGETAPDYLPPYQPIDCSAADVNADGYVSMQEAFTWAQSHDGQSQETPQWYENPDGLGDYLWLGGLLGGTGVNITNYAASRDKADRVTVSWTVSDVSTLAGFNIYRALPGKESRYERLNSKPIIGNSPFHYDDFAAVKGQKYLYKLEAVETSGMKSSVGPFAGQSGNGMPTNFALNVYPNPAHGAVKMDYSIASTFGNTNTRLSVIDLSGRTVKILVNGPVAPGAYNMQWDGTDTAGRAVSPGVYICTMNAGGQSLTKRIVFVH